MGTVILLLDYIICGLALYSFVFCRYESKKLEYNYEKHEYDRECTNIRVKTPLWMVLLLTLLYSIPFMNLALFAILTIHYCESNYCYKSFLTKEI